jgi:hypothetical protein
MKNIMFYGLLAAGLMLASCNTKTASPDEVSKMSAPASNVNIKLSELASNKDLNCDMQLINGAIADTATYQGKIYGF